jgi:type I restriction enzyme, S subunit
MREWPSKKLREVIGRPISGSRPVGGVNTETEGIPSLGGENILAGGGVTFDNLNRVSVAFYNSMPKGRLQPLDVLINKDGAQTGKVGLYKGDFPDACVNEHLFILRNIDRAIDQRFLFYSILLPDTQTKIARRITGSAQPGLNTTFVDAVEILVPPNSREQRKIAEILSTVDEAIEQTEALVKKLQQMKAGLMHDLFTRGVTPDGHLRPTRQENSQPYKEVPQLGWIPNDWDAKPLVELYQNPIRDFGSFASTNLITFLDSGVPFIKSEMIGVGEICWDSVMFISERVHQLLGKSHVWEGLILFSKIGSALGKAVIYDGSHGECH